MPVSTETETRRLRVRVLRPASQEGVALRGIDVKPLAWAATPAAFLQNVATTAPRGRYPRGMQGEQSYWTVLGVDGAKEEALLGEDGAVETGKGRFAIEPFLSVDGRLITWADVTSVPSLADGDLPIPVGDVAKAECTPLHRGRTTTVWQTRITRGDGKLAAVVTQTQLMMTKGG